MRSNNHLSLVPDLPEQADANAWRYVPHYDYHSSWRNADLVSNAVGADLFWLVQNQEKYTNPTLGPRFYPSIEINTPAGNTTGRLLVFQNLQVLRGEARPTGIRSAFLNLDPAVIIADRPVGAFGYSITNPEEITITHMDEDPATAPLNRHVARDDFVLLDDTYLMAATLLNGYAEGLKLTTGLTEKPKRLRDDPMGAHMD